MSFRTALSGLNAATADLRVIGNNVANASTTGFKKSRAEFSDIYAASNYGVAANAIGSGVKVAAITQQFTQGNVEFTNNNLDLAINGHGFFMLDDNGARSYTRSGAFGVDNAGFVVNNNHKKLLAYTADAAGNITGSLGTLQLNTANITPQVTSTVDVGLNLDATQTQPPVAFSPTVPSSYNNSTSLTVYDSLGSPHLATMYYAKTATANQWNVYGFIDGNALRGGPPYTADTMTFNGAGQLSAINGAAAAPPGAIAYPAYTPGNGANPMTVTMNYLGASPTTQYGSSFGVNSLTQNGYATGRLSTIAIDTSGIVQARYTNGQNKTLAQVALANFANPQGLRQLGHTSWAESFDSGAALVGAPGTASLGAIQSGALEGSNVDLTAQLVKMITAQRNFQANAKMIKTSDTITQTAINTF